MATTEENLKAAFAGESQARNKYTFFASVARKEGFEQIAAIFEETADNEKEHAKLHFKLLGMLGDTKKNLKEAIKCHIQGLLKDGEPIPKEENTFELVQTFTEKELALKC